MVAAKLLANLDSVQEQLVKTSGELETAKVEILKAESDLSAGILAEEARLLQLRKLLLNGTPIKAEPKPKMKLPGGKDLYGDQVKANDENPKGEPKELGSGEKDGRQLTWYSYSERPGLIFLFAEDQHVGTWSVKGARYRRVVNGVQVGEPTALPIPLPKL